jgi:peptidoglycan/LPS O-acetylase OafA/YrhL
VCAMVPELGAVFARSWPWYVTYTTNIQLAFVEEDTIELTRHLWSLAVEEQFYLIWPLVIAWMPRRWLLSFTCVAIGLIVAGRLWWAHHEPGPYAIYASTWTRADALLLGAAVALTRTNSASWRRLVTLAPLVVLLSAACFWVPAVRALIDELEAHFTLTAVLFAALLTMCVARDERAGSSSWLRHPVLQHIGRLSYGIYLYQFGLALYGPIFFERWFPLGRTNALAAFVVIAALSYALAAISYRYIEAPILRLKRFFPRPIPNNASAPTKHTVTRVAADYIADSESGSIRSQQQRG